MAGGAPQLLARLMRPGAPRGVSRSLTWNELDPYRFHVPASFAGSSRPSPGRVYAVHGARARHARYSYGYGGQKTLDLAVCDSPQLWSVLDDAQRLGLRLLHAHADLGEVGCHRGELVIDVTGASDGESLVRIGLRLADGKPATWCRWCSSARPVTVSPASSAPMWRRVSRSVALAWRSYASPGQRRRRCSECSWRASGWRSRRASSSASRSRSAQICAASAWWSPPMGRSRRRRSRHRRWSCAPRKYGEGHALSTWAGVELIRSAPRRDGAARHHRRPHRFRDLDAERAILGRTVLAETGLARFNLLDATGRPLAQPQFR